MLSLHVSKVIVSRQLEEADEEKITPMMVDEPQPYDEPFAIPEAGGTLGEFETKEVIPAKTGESNEVQPKAEDIDEESPSKPVTTKGDPSLRAGHAVPTSVALGATSSHHYSRKILVKVIRNLMGFSSPDKLVYDNDPFFKGLNSLSTSVKAF